MRIAEVATVRGAEQWVEHNNAPDIVFLDMNLPDGVGLHALRRVIAATSGQSAIVILTGVEDDSLARACVEAGANDFVHKHELRRRELVRATEYSMARAKAHQLTRQLEHTDRLAALGQIAAGVAHEINNPTAFVQTGLTELLLRTQQAQLDGTALDLADVRSTLADLIDGVERIAGVASALGDFARGTDRDFHEVVDVPALCQRSVHLVSNQIRHAARLELDLKQTGRVRCDPRRLCQVIVNLLLNAAQAVEQAPARSDHRVTLRTVDDGKEVVITVADTGIGIPESSRDQLFDPFYSTKKASGGTGLGLAISREIVEQVGGTISVESVVGHGSIFSVTLPRHTATSMPAVTLDKPEPRRVSRRVLLIDDEPMLLRAMGRILERTHEVTSADSGVAALELLAKEPSYDAIICDLMMPRLDGAQTYAEIQTRFPALAGRVIILSGGAATPRTSALVHSNTVPVLQKPIHIDDLLDAIDAIASGSRGPLSGP